VIHWLRRVDLEHSEKASLTRKSALSTASVGVQGIVRFAYSVLIGRWLTPAVLAATNSAISLALFVSLLWPTATGAAATKFIARSRGAGDHLMAARIATYLGRVTLVSALALSIPAGIFSFVFQDRHDWLASVMVMALIVAWSGYTYVRGIYFAIGQIGRALVWDALSSVTAIGLLVCVLLFRWDEFLLVPLTVGYLLYSVTGWPRRSVGTVLPAELRAEMNHFIRWTVVGTLAAAGFLQLTMVIAHGVGTGVEAGMYAAALTLATPASMLARSFSLVLFPAMAQAAGRDDLAGVRRQTNLATQGLVAVMGAIFGALILLSDPLIAIAYGSRYAEAGEILPILLTASLFVSMNVAAVNALSAATASGVRIPSLLSLLGVGIGILGMVVLIPDYGVIGVAWSYLAGTVVTGFGPIIFVWRQERMLWTGLWLRFLGGGAAVTLLYLAKDALPWGYLGDAVSVIVFLAVWILLMRPQLVLLNAARRGEPR